MIYWCGVTKSLLENVVSWKIKRGGPHPSGYPQPTLIHGHAPCLSGRRPSSAVHHFGPITQQVIGAGSPDFKVLNLNLSKGCPARKLCTRLTAKSHSTPFAAGPPGLRHPRRQESYRQTVNSLHLHLGFGVYIPGFRFVRGRTDRQRERERDKHTHTHKHTHNHKNTTAQVPTHATPLQLA